MSKGSSNISIIGALVANIAVAITKFIAAAYTGSSAMISEGIHSVVDSANVLLLLFGQKRSLRPASKKHPFGHGKEIYFWTLVVAISLFAIGGGMSIYEGITHIQHPVPIEDPIINYIILGLALLFNGISWIIAFKEFNKTKSDLSLWKAIQNSKDPATFAILFEDTADILGLIVAFLGVFLGQLYNDPIIDGFASIIIGVILTVTSMMLAYESKGLLIGESAENPVLDSIQTIACNDDAVDNVGPPLSMHFGPTDVMIALGINFKENLTSTDVAISIDRIEKAIRHAHPEVKRIFIEAKAIAKFKD